MPKTVMDFSNTVIYHFVCQDTKIKCEYVGSTTNFNQRKGDHKKICNNESAGHHHYKIYQTIREHGGWNNWDMKPLEEFPCENKTQQVIREQYWIDKLKPGMNCMRSYREGETISEKMKVYNKANSVAIAEQKKAWREANPELIKERKSAFYQANKEGILQKQKAYAKANAEAISEKKKVRREANKEVIKEKGSIQYTCECGSICRVSDKARHERTQKHQAFIVPIV